MRITDPKVILNGEKDLIASVQKNLDLDAVRDLLKERLTVRALSPKGGRIVVHNNDVAFRLDYEINLDGSLLFDRHGNLLEDRERTVQASDLDDHLSINLPDYNEAPDEGPGKDQADVPGPEGLAADLQDVEPGLEIEDLEDESAFAFDQDDSDLIKADDGDELIDDLTQADGIEDLSAGELPDIGLEDGYTEAGQDMVDDDISDILQESRDFWEKKKEK